MQLRTNELIQTQKQLIQAGALPKKSLVPRAKTPVSEETEAQQMNNLQSKQYLANVHPSLIEYSFVLSLVQNPKIISPPKSLKN